MDTANQPTMQHSIPQPHIVCVCVYQKLDVDRYVCCFFTPLVHKSFNYIPVYTAPTLIMSHPHTQHFSSLSRSPVCTTLFPVKSSTDGVGVQKKKYKIHTCQSVSELGTNIQVGHEVYSRGAPKTGSQFICYFSNLPQNTMRNQKKISVLTPKQAHGEGVESYVSCSNTSSKSYRGGVRLNGTVSLQH